MAKEIRIMVKEVLAARDARGSASVFPRFEPIIPRLMETLFADIGPKLKIAIRGERCLEGRVWFSRN